MDVQVRHTKPPPKLKKSFSNISSVLQLSMKDMGRVKWGEKIARHGRGHVQGLVKGLVEGFVKGDAVSEAESQDLSRMDQEIDVTSDTEDRRTPLPPPRKEWIVTTFAGSGQRGFKNAVGEAARFNYPHGICIADDGRSVMVLDSYMSGAHNPADDLEATRFAAEAEAARQVDLKKQADMAECTAFLRDSDFVKLGHTSKMDQKTLDRLWRWCHHEVEQVEGVMARKARSMFKSGMTNPDDMTRRLAGARNVETLKRFHFNNVMHMMRGKDFKNDPPLTLHRQSTSSKIKMGNSFDAAIMTANVVETDLSLLNHGPKMLRQFRAELSQRFNSVFDAWIFFDMDADGSMSHKEFVHLCGPLRLPKDLPPPHIFQLIDTARLKEITPLAFVEAVKWHKAPLTDRVVLLMLDSARDKRSEILTAASRRTAELHHLDDEAAAEKAEMRRKSHKPPPIIKVPVRVPVIKLPRNATSPRFDPIDLAMSEALRKSPDVNVQVALVAGEKQEPMYTLPEEIETMNWKVAIELDHRKKTGLDKIKAFDQRIQRVSTMVSEAYIKRGRIWRLADGADKDVVTNWSLSLLVMTEKGQLMLEDESSESSETSKSSKGNTSSTLQTASTGMLIDFDMRNIIKHERLEIKCLGASCIELVFRTVKQRRRVTHYLYLAFGDGEAGDILYAEWWSALRKFSWRADDVNTSHLNSNWNPEEQEIWDEMHHTIKAKFELRRIQKVQRWFRQRKTERAAHAAATHEAREQREHLLRLAYIRHHSGFIGDQAIVGFLDH